MHHYDLLERRGWVARTILIVSPYVEKEFFSRIVDELKPRTLIIVIDDGCRAEDVRMLRGLSRRGMKVQVVLGSARGLVHAKIFYTEWLTSGGQSRHTLVYGSGNATRQAFDGQTNSEVMCKARLTAANHAPILRWTNQVCVAAASAEGAHSEVHAIRDIWLADGISIRLPRIKIRESGNKAHNFDLWLQRGRLLATFQPDPSFLRVHITLRNELPPGRAEEIVLNTGFETARTRKLSFAYVSAAERADEDSDGPGNWRSQFFLWTQLGYWCSESCYDMHRDLFRKSGHQSRIANLERLLRLSEYEAKEKECQRFLDRIEALWTAFGPEAATYLEAQGDQIDCVFYREAFELRLRRDLDLANDAEFRSRYINGCEIIDMPRFRTDTAAWKSFVDSFARQMHLESLKNRSNSIIFQRISSAISIYGTVVFDDPKTITSSIRSKWNADFEHSDGVDKSLGEYIDAYHIVDRPQM